MKELASLNRFFVRYKWHVLGGILFVNLSNYFRILQPRMLRHALDTVVKKLELMKGKKLQYDSPEYVEIGRELLYFGGLVLLFAILMGVFMYFMRQSLIVMSRLVEYDMRKEIFDHYQKLDLAFYRRNKTGDLMSRVTEDVNKVRNYFGPVLMYGVNLISLFSLTIYSMLAISPKLTFFSLLPLPFLVLAIYYVSDQIHKRSTAIQAQLSDLTSEAQEAYSGIRVIKSYAQEGLSNAHFLEESNSFRKKTLNLAKIDNAFFPIMLIMIGASMILTIYVGGLIIINSHEITYGNIAEFMIYVSMLTWPVTSIGWTASLAQQAAASQKRINEFLNTKPAIFSENVDKSLENKGFDGNIEFKNVSLKYPDTGIEALKNITFSLKKGERMAIIGRTGSGKTTLADLLVRMYDPTEGTISIDHTDLKKVSVNRLRQHVGYVPQDLFLFSETVEQNIAFGASHEMSRAEVEDFAKHAAVYDDIVGLSNGFDTMVGERGVTLSGGQKQRVSIARALAKQPDIVLLDDCLSAVDTATEQAILGYLNTALGDKTTIIITHRIYGLLQFDKIIVLEDGAIAEQGTHESLLEKRGFYYELFEAQRDREDAINA
ncbi:MAG: hypothetical protein RL757_2691 [Bacteroidota bacterium]|jgi:ATP-binding cassette subfamily B protein